MALNGSLTVGAGQFFFIALTSQLWLIFSLDFDLSGVASRIAGQTGTIGRMCGRFVSFTVEEQLLGQLENIPGLAPISIDGKLPGPRYNIGPTMPVVAVARGGEPSETIAAAVRWGLVPHWAKEMQKTPYFNARAETWREKPTFRAAQPCVIPMDGWYEWRDKKPYFVSLHDDNHSVFTVAGLWARNGDLVSCTIITTPAVGHLTALHHRMPRVLADDEVSAWLDQTGWARGGEVGQTAAELVERLHLREVNKAVGSVRNEGAWLLGDCGDGRTGELF